MTINDHDFDARLRGHHAQALANMSARTQAQLLLRRRAATTPVRPPSTRAYAWPLAAACAAAVLVVGLQWRQADPAATAASPVAASSGVADTPVTAGDGDLDAYAALDETPDLYLWLASSDAAALAME